MKRLVTPPGMSVPNTDVPSQAAQLNLNPRDLEDVVCDACENYTFQNVVLMKRISALQSPSGREAFVPVEVFACAACGHVNDRFIQGLRGWFKKTQAEVMAETAQDTQTAPVVVTPEPSAPATIDEIVTSDLKTVEVEDQPDGALAGGREI